MNDDTEGSPEHDHNRNGVETRGYFQLKTGPLPMRGARTHHCTLVLLSLLAAKITAQGASSSSREVARQTSVAASREYLENASRHACFRDAFERLRANDCAELPEDDRRRLALAFTVCHLVTHGRANAPAPCAPDAPIVACVRPLSDVAFDLYSDFLLHACVQRRRAERVRLGTTSKSIKLSRTENAIARARRDNVCFFLWSQRWQERADRAANQLIAHADVVSQQLRDQFDATVRGLTRGGRGAETMIGATDPRP